VAAAPQWAQTPPPPPPPGAYYAAPPAAFGSSAGGMAGLLALVGGAVAIGSAWLPWMIIGGEWAKGIDATQSDMGLANGNYLVAAGAVAAVCGLLLVLGIARSPSMKLLLGLGAIAGGIGVCVIEAAAYMKVNDTISLYNSTGGLGSMMGVSIGWGIYVGAAGGAVAALGGLLALAAKPGAAGAPARSNTMMPLVAVIAVVAIVGGIVAWPQISKQINGDKSSPSIGLGTHGPTAEPTEAPTPKTTTAPTPAGSFYTRGYATPELAINQFVVDQKYTYGGDCTSPKSGTNYCSSYVSDVSSGSVYAIGGIDSEAEVWALMRKIGGKWYMVDVAKATASPPWD
jgi:MFS family permease